MKIVAVEAKEEPIPELEEIKRDVDAGKEPRVSVRELVRWFGARRRGGSVVERVETELEALGLRTDPHFTTTWIDAPVTFRKREPVAKAAGAAPVAPGDELPDMALRVRMLEAANRGVLAVSPQDPIEKAVTLMLSYDYSQLAVMTTPCELKGAISWKSIGSRLSQRSNLKHVSDAIEPAAEVNNADSLFDATKTIIERDYVFVRADDNKVSGIVTATDLSERFHGLSEPFLILGRVENHIRRIIDSVFDAETIRAACDSNDPKRKAQITKAAQLTFGEYLRIFQKEENWKKLGFVACQKTFCKELDEVRKLRNDIMHFRPADVIEGSDFEPLRRFSRLLDRLQMLSK